MNIHSYKTISFQKRFSSEIFNELKSRARRFNHHKLFALCAVCVCVFCLKCWIVPYFCFILSFSLTIYLFFHWICYALLFVQRDFICFRIRNVSVSIVPEKTTHTQTHRYTKRHSVFLVSNIK